MPVFARQYGVSCQVCHTTIPELNKFGQSFRDSGYRWPAAIPKRGTVPIAMKVNLTYTSAADPTGLPKAVVDEIEFLSFGPIGKHMAYRVEHYWVDAGRLGRMRDAFLEYRSDPQSSWRGYGAPVLDIQLGQFTLPLPDDPETLRPTENHYAIFDQTVGGNSFNLFDDRIGVNAGFGNRTAEVRALAMKDGDTMLSARIGPAAFSLWAYRYRGTRPLGLTTDDFIRRGVGLTSATGKAQTSLLLQTGNDSNPFGFGNAASSSGGYFQEEWAFSPRWIATVRYDGLNGPDGFSRSTTLSLSHRPYDRARWTVEDVIQPQPQMMHTLNVAWLFAY